MRSFPEERAVLIEDTDSATVYVVIEGPQSEEKYFKIRHCVPGELGNVELRFMDVLPRTNNGSVGRSAILQILREEKSKVKPGIFKIRSQNEIGAPHLNQFLNTCRQLGYANNESLEKLGFYDVNPPDYWFAMKDEQIVAMSGIHRIEIQGKVFTRSFHRTCILPQYCGRGVGSLSRRIENSALFSHFLKVQLEWAAIRGYDSGLYVTTNNENNTTLESRNWLIRSHKIFQHLHELNFAHKLENNVFLRGVYQTLWKLNLESFNTSRIECGHSRLF